MDHFPWTSIGAGCFMFFILERFAAVALHYSPASRKCKTGEYSLFGPTYLDAFNSIFERVDQPTDTNTSAQHAAGTTSTGENLPAISAVMALRVKEVFACIVGAGEGAMHPGDVSAVSAFDLSRSLATKMNNQLLFGDELAENDEFEEHVIRDTWLSTTRKPMHYSSSEVQSLVELQQTASCAIVDLCQDKEQTETLRQEIRSTFQSSVGNPYNNLRLMDAFLEKSHKLNRADAFASFAMKHILVHLLTNFDLDLAAPNAPRPGSDVCIDLRLQATEQISSSC